MFSPQRFSLIWAALLLGTAAAWAQAQSAPPGALTPPVTANPGALADAKVPERTVSDRNSSERSVSEWLVRMHEASRKRAYVGTFVVSSANSMSTAKIWHVCDGTQQLERVEALTGAPRSIFRRNNEVITFHADTKTAVSEKRESLGVFPGLLKSNDSAIGQFYGARQQGTERVAGFDADVLLLQPKDALRFGYRVWSEKKTGLVVKLHTLDTDGRVLEQAAFSELQLDAPVSMAKLNHLMGQVEGYKVVKPELIKTTALSEGWLLKTPVPGFKPTSCFKRVVAKSDGANPDTADTAMQWIFSDGLASVSLFVEAFDRLRHGQEGLQSVGATHALTRRLPDKAGDKAGDWWLTVVGEVPPQALASFAQSLERKNK